MKVIKFDSARATWLFPLEEFGPVAGSNNPSVISQIAQRYGFAQVPTITTQEAMAKNGLPFGMGHFQNRDSRFAVTDFVVYNDGLVAIAEKTEWAEAFLEDVTTWVKSEFNFREVVSGIRKLYASTIVVDFESPLSRLLKGYEVISNLITSHAVTITPHKTPLQFSRLDFEVDRTVLAGQLALPKFVIERRAGVSFDHERYYCNAPMHTETHLSVLKEIEDLAKRQ
ncbi:hypothetical protein IVB08_00305 [Bradyrhizobium sp. 173]|uniref:hypothetical protein n=1 Tax=Bradyrhizobium sp. 173 TaxID=2782644 RepID=UPI001FF750F6|nr:hypothetical protein [Bradyrhizobium sp. 173]MCK1562452.1 hypothetical protein [Bradyrhizobium sp. 173]